MESKNLNYKSSKIHYLKKGKGTAIFLLHGLNESSEIWSKIGDEINKNNQVFIPDFLGNGQSDSAFDEDYSMENLADLLKNILDQETIKSAIFIGHSMGAYVALAFAEKHPEMIQGLMLFHSTAIADADQKKHDRTRTVNVLLKNKDLYFKAIFGNLFAVHRTDEFKKEVENLYQKSKEISTETAIGYMKALRDRKDRMEVLKNLTCPKYYFIGKFDNILPYEEIIKQAQETGSEYFLSENSGHMGFYEDEKGSLECIRKFIEKVES